MIFSPAYDAFSLAPRIASPKISIPYFSRAGYRARSTSCRHRRTDRESAHFLLNTALPAPQALPPSPDESKLPPHFFGRQNVPAQSKEASGSRRNRRLFSPEAAVQSHNPTVHSQASCRTAAPSPRKTVWQTCSFCLTACGSLFPV